jgi:hypothetical protein
MLPEESFGANWSGGTAMGPSGRSRAEFVV